ncbi:nucleotidyltransferase [Streptomyces pluripotens]|uniref:Nucleotidyltransferase n=1 Tax=Streptomyces pluripotens TaxID=1355015 RepID=A0A221P1A6_9ACTN|nr:nucleotidyltransferase [Streptomyces pluripotens]ARP71757.1 nucleotidyltransferase [Streptomyces pluripotens]ASN26010.1 nucleotidyltransferase [Streptomyces pluripotens]
MILEEKLSGWTGPSSATEQDKQDRTERMIREAIKEHAAFHGCDLSVYAKGSYANNTNVKADSDVDIAVQCGEAVYWDEATEGAHPPSGSYTGIWTPAKLRSELEAALRAKFPGQVDSSGSTAFRIHSSSARVDADVVPCFEYEYHFSSTSYRKGAKVFKKNGASLVNYPKQQLENGRAKNTRTRQYYKKAVRIMKRVENAMVAEDVHREVPSFFVESLVYNCPDSVFLEPTWTKTIEGIIVHIWQELEGAEPSEESERWFEVNDCKFLFHGTQDWSRQDARDFVKAAWNYLGYAS